MGRSNGRVRRATLAASATAVLAMQRTKVFDWRVPIVVGGRRARIKGDLYWVPKSAGLPHGALLALAAIVFAGIAVVELSRRRRAKAGVQNQMRGESK
jgi:hypothetical protein